MILNQRKVLFLIIRGKYKQFVLKMHEKTIISFKKTRFFAFLCFKLPLIA